MKQTLSKRKLALGMVIKDTNEVTHQLKYWSCYSNSENNLNIQICEKISRLTLWWNAVYKGRVVQTQTDKKKCRGEKEMTKYHIQSANSQL